MQQSISMLLSLAALLCFTAVSGQDEYSNLQMDLAALRKEMTEVVDAMQWQMYHVGASAACSGVTNYQHYWLGSNRRGNHNGLVYALPAGKTCDQVCANTIFKTCANTVRVHGAYGSLKQETEIAGYYYTLGCAWKNGNHYAEKTRSREIDAKGWGVLKTKKNTMAHYCCCTYVKTGWKIVDDVTGEEVPSIKQ